MVSRTRSHKLLQVDNPPGTFDKRVFVGGNYDFLATLRKICDFIRSTGFTPIMAWDFNVDFRRIHDYDLRLLHQCKYAIFEETSPAGELMELERTRDYGVISFAVYQVRDRDTKRQSPPSQITGMATTYGIALVGYSTFEQLERFIRDVFSSIRKQKLGDALVVIAKAQWLPPDVKSLVMSAIGSTMRKRKRFA
jgi:hypothetical protein